MEITPAGPSTGGPADRFTSHLAMWEGDESSRGEHVTDEEYGR